MSDSHVCPERGWIIGTTEWLPSEPFDYQWASTGLIVGCNRLRCDECGEQVVISATPDGIGRLYRCQCQTWRGLGAQQLTAPLDPIEERRLPWQCEGHPPLQLPATVDGVALDANSDWKQLAREVYSGARDLFPDPATRSFRGFFIGRLHGVLSAADAAPISLAVSELLLDADPLVRSCALFFFVQNYRAPGAERIVDAARDHADLFRGVADPLGGTLFMLLTSTLSARMHAGDSLAGDLLKQAALQPPGVGMLLYSLPAVWVDERADQILQADPARWATVLNALSGEGEKRLVELAELIRARGYATAAEINAAATQQLSVPKAKAVADALASSN